MCWDHRPATKHTISKLIFINQYYQTYHINQIISDTIVIEILSFVDIKS